MSAITPPQSAPAPYAPPDLANRPSLATHPDRWREMVERECQLSAPARPAACAVETHFAEGAGDMPRSVVHEFVITPPRDLFGLSLSGGGIRSATFNLGLLQGLDGVGLLGALDYLSTVSGGGYIGSFWSAWMARDPGARRGRFPAPGDAQGVECPEVEHLRRFSNFLSPRLGVLSYDTGRMVVALVGGLVPALLASLSLLLGALVAWLVLAQLVFGQLGANGGLVSTGALAALTAAVLVVSEVRWRARKEPGQWGWYALATLVATALAATAWVTFASRVSSPYDATGRGGEWLGDWIARLPIPNAPVGARWLALMAPAAAWAAAAMAFVVWRLVFSFRGATLAARPRDGSVDRVISRLLFLTAGWIVVTLIWDLGALLWRSVWQLHTGATATSIGALAAAASAAFGKLQHLLSREPNRSTGASLAGRIRPRLPQILAYVALVAMVCGVVLLVCVASADGWTSAALASAAGITLLVLFTFDPNAVGLHAFYRDRLARAYLGASNPAPRERFRAVRSTRRAPLDTAEVQPGDDVGLEALASNRPLQLVCCAANDLDSADPVATLRRGAVSAVLSTAGFSVGSEATGWEAPSAAAVPSLATAITASAAAFNPQMGSKSIELGPAVTFLMATFNLRLGVWLAHPSRADAPVPRLLRGRAFYAELFGRSRATGKRVHLSDGGHFENMALFELLRRHCRYVIASDCGCDPDVGFDDFGNLVRRAREDLGIEIEIDLAPLRPRENGYAAQPMVAGDIHYPNGDVGVLLLFKPTLTGDEPVDVCQYHARNAVFPNESTGDQFYDEAQWEAYRRLGVNAVWSAFRSVRDSVGDVVPGDADSAARAFAHARKQWLPAPECLPERVQRLASRAAALDAKLLADASSIEAEDVYDELGAILGGPRRRATPVDVANALAIVREALLFMDEAFVTEDLERNGGHPQYLGLVNYMARWTHAEQLRAWWPVLRPMHGEKFVRFVEHRLGLAPAGVADVYATAQLSADVFAPGEPEALATRSYAEERPGGAAWNGGGTPRELSLIVPLLLGAGAVCDIQVGLVAAYLEDGALVWDAADFYVAPSLWGSGLGETFLDRLAAGSALHGATSLLVRIPSPTDAGRVVLKQGADRTQMYRAAGFAEVRPIGEGRWAMAGSEIVGLGVVAPAGPPARWMWRRVVSGTGGRA